MSQLTDAMSRATEKAFGTQKGRSGRGQPISETEWNRLAAAFYAEGLAIVPVAELEALRKAAHATVAAANAVTEGAQGRRRS